MKYLKKQTKKHTAIPPKSGEKTLLLQYQDEKHGSTNTR